jgi:hypothetical protein
VFGPDGVGQDIRIRGLHEDRRVVDESDAQVGDAARRRLSRARVREPAPLTPAPRRDPFQEIGKATDVPVRIVEAAAVEVVGRSQKCIRRSSGAVEGLGISRKRLS